MESFDFQAFNVGDYYQAVNEKLVSETVTKVLNFLDEVCARFPGDEARVARMSLIGEEGDKRVRMAHLATIGSHAVNGVAALHSDLLKASVLKDFYELWPERFSNKTNGVTPRRFLALANPGLRNLLNRTIGDQWLAELAALRKLESHAEDPAFRRDWRAVKQANKQRLAEYIRAHTNIELDPSWLFDVQVKRIHEYKRQHLNVLHIITLYRRLKEHPALAVVPRAFIFGGKAAPGYFAAKRIIKLIHAVAETVNADPDVNTRMKVASCPTSTSRMRSSSIRPPTCPSRSPPPARRRRAPAT